MSWGELERASSSLAQRLQRHGMRPGDRVAVLSENSFDFVLTICAIWKAGGALAPLSTFLQPDATATILDDCEATMLIASERCFKTLDAASSATDRRPAPPVIRMDELVDRDAAATPQAFEPPPWSGVRAHLANIIYSSGTTGTPKGIPHTYALRSLQAQGFCRGLHIDASSGVLLSTPLSSNWTLTALAAALCGGAAMYLLPKFEEQAFLETAARFKPTHSFLVPTQIERILDFAAFERFDLSHGGAKFSAGAPKGNAGALAGQAYRTLRHDRRLRDNSARRRGAPRQTRFRRPPERRH